MYNELGVKQLVFGTVIRNAPIEKAGELVLLDWTSKTALRRAPVFPENPRMDDDQNPRGNARGCKGVAVLRNKIIAANFHTLKIFDSSLSHIRDLSDGLMVGLHEIFVGTEDNVWIASTVIDAAVEYDLNTGTVRQSFWPREVQSFQHALGVEPADIDKNADNRRRFLTDDHLHSGSHLHLNAVTPHNGEVYALFHAFGAVCNLSTGKVVVQDKNLVKGHNLVFLNEDTFVVNDTYGRKLRFYDVTSGRSVSVINLLQFDWVQELLQDARRASLPRKVLSRVGLTKKSISRPLFVRGLAHDRDYLYVGLSPASIVCINWRNKEFVDAYKYSDNPDECVHGLAIAS